LLRYLEECDEVTIDEAAMVAACLAALAGDRYQDALEAPSEQRRLKRRGEGRWFRPSRERATRCLSQ